MATIKETRRRSLLIVLGLVTLVALIVAAAVLFQQWKNNRPGTPAQEVSITASVNGSKIDVHPYMACEPGQECKEGTVPNIAVGPNDTLVLDIPEAIHNHDWQVLMIYDDPAANDQQLHGAFDTDKVEIPGSVDPIAAGSGGRPRLQVVEVSSIMLGEGTDGPETPLSTVWSLSTQEK